jgi:hypothetical protein
MDDILNAAGALFPVLLVVLAVRPVTGRELDVFAGRYFLGADMISPTLSKAIARSRGLRLLGAAMGFSLPVLVRTLTHDSLNTGPAGLWGVAGYLGGALLAVLLPIARPGHRVHAAALVPRRARDYLPRRTLAAPAVAVALSLLAVSIFVWAPRRPEAVGDSAPWGALILTVAAALATVVGAHWVVRRRQPVPDADVLAVDDALRSYALHLVFGAGIAVGALAASTTLFRAGSASGVQMLRWTLPWFGLAEFAFALFAWAGLRNDAWRVRPKVPT